jgi:phosphopantothenoylcysteine decarboxylase / phosphopantothenate---cysteine ligase
MLIAPATANTIARLAHGLADDLVTAAALAARIPVLIAPAMNSAMYENPATQENLRALSERGYGFIDPGRGFLAERERGIGRLADETELLEALERTLNRAQSLQGQNVVITAGPTREAFDPIRFVSNASTGSTGIALAREAAMRGARVTLLLGPTLLEPPSGVNVHRFTTADELHRLALEAAANADLFIASAAVADYRPAQREVLKMKKGEGDLTVAMVRTPDVLAAVGERKNRMFLVGFAAETDAHEEHAREKLVKKHLDAIVVNDVRDERGFGTGSNTLTVLWKGGRKELGTASKTQLAVRLLDAIEELR